MNEFSGGFYRSWRKKRFDSILKHYGKEFFQDKTVLELAAANGDLGNMFHEVGSKVTCFEGRQGNVDVLKEKYPHLDAHVVNLDEPTRLTENKFDVVLHIGLLYHLLNMESSLVEAMKCCDHLILETEVMDSDVDGYFVTTEDHTRMTSSLDGVSTRPTNAMLKRIIEDNGFSIEYPENPKTINTHPYIYDWNPNNHGLLYGARILWFLRRK
jgi:2-polyprenyl-3-methyl-5-hydroxy-6-metoxy-1,4-benzoquinol methylase